MGVCSSLQRSARLARSTTPTRHWLPYSSPQQSARVVRRKKRTEPEDAIHVAHPYHIAKRTSNANSRKHCISRQQNGKIQICRTDRTGILKLERVMRNMTALPSPAASDHERIFQMWADKRARDSYDPLTPAAARPYRSMWKSWGDYLHQAGGPDRTWRTARPSDLAAFMFKGGIAPAGQRRTTLSDISRQRYWVVIGSIYAYAKSLDAIDVSPADGMAPGEIPALLQSEGQIFHSIDWQAIERSLPDGESTVDIRNKAMVMLIMDAALTTSEVAELRVNSCMPTINMGMALMINGPRGAQKRDIFLGLDASDALKRWLEVRARISLKREPADALFTTQKHGAMRPSGVYHVVNQIIHKATGDGTALSTHTGAQRLRNTRIVQWLNSGMEPGEVAKRAGLKDKKSFRGLERHINPDVSRVMTKKRKKDSGRHRSKSQE